MIAVLLPLLLASVPSPAPAERSPSEDPILPARRALVAAARGDPPVAEVQRAAGRCAETLEGERDVLDRARVAALLPQVTAEVRVDDRSYRVTGLQSSGEVDYSRYAPGWYAGLRATWDLAALVSPPGVRPTARGLLDRARRRDAAVRSATALYFERRRLRLGLELSPPAAAAERAARELEVERLAAELDALTGGAFTRGQR
jgi:hypothetical protein